MVRLMLLERLLQNLPQLRNVGGVRAIPYMQVSEEGSELSPNQTVQSLVSVCMCFSLPAQSQCEFICCSAFLTTDFCWTCALSQCDFTAD